MHGRIIGRAALASALALFASGCGVTDSGGMSQAEVEAFTQQIAGPAAGSLSSATGSMSSPLGTAGLARGPAVLINAPFSAQTNCTAGGNIKVSGSWTGSIDQTGSGVLSLQANETITDWQCISGHVFNGDPYVSLAGTFSFLNGNLNSPASMSMGGGFKWDGGSCQIQLTFLIYADGHGTVSGQVCGRSVNISVS